MKKFIKGTFKFKKLKNPDTDLDTLANSLVDWADAHNQIVGSYTYDDDPTTLYVDYEFEANTEDLCKALVKELKVEARPMGLIELVSEMKGERR